MTVAVTYYTLYMSLYITGDVAASETGCCGDTVVVRNGLLSPYMRICLIFLFIRLLKSYIPDTSLCI